jgi:hypothetical protein
MSSDAGAAAGYLQTLSDELTQVGIRGALRRRIVTEFADHLESDPDADLGFPHALARQFAVLEAAAVLAGFGLLGPYLGLRSG